MEKPVRPTVLYGEYELTLDEKNRISIPSEVRRSLDPEQEGEAFFIVLGPNHKLWLYPEHVFNRLTAQRSSTLLPRKTDVVRDQRAFSMTQKAAWDAQGRMQLQQLVLRRARLGKEVTLIGVRDHLELWDRAQWTQYSEQLLAQSEEDTGWDSEQANPPAL